MIETREILADAYKGKDVSARPMLSHAVQLDNVSRPLRVLCGRVRLDSLADAGANDTTQPPTCQRCLSALRKREKGNHDI